jgi:peptide-methionine (S)-S-oxide reductase
MEGMTDDGSITRTPGTDTAVLAGGCFWGMEDLIRRQPGVLDTRVGYTGGQNDHATYRNHPATPRRSRSSTTRRDDVPGHPGLLLPDSRPVNPEPPGQRHRDELPVGDLPSMPSRSVARETIADVDASGLWPAKAVTTIEAAGPFWEAEPEHQDYLLRIPNGYTCHFPRAGWVLPKRADA